MNEFDKKVLRASSRTVVVRRDGHSEELTITDAMLGKQQESALKGSPMAQRDGLAAIRRATEAQEKRAAEGYELWSGIRAENQTKLDAARKSGETTAHILPHPDDILLGGPEGVRIVGPIDADDAVRFRKLVHLRDTLALQQFMEDAQNGIRRDDRPSRGSALVLAVYLNDLLPPSLQRSQVEEVVHLMKLASLSKRELLTETRKAWRVLGMEVARGSCLRGMRETMLWMDLLLEYAAVLVRHPGNLDAERGAADHATARFLEELPVARRLDATKGTARITMDEGLEVTR